MVPPWVADYVGTPYEEADCWQPTRRVMAEQYDTFLPSHFGAALKAALHDGRLFQVTDPQAGDLIVMQRGGRPHIGVMVDDARMLHTSEGKNAVCERVSSLWHRVAGYFRVQGARQAAPALD
jgi:cell wall-associated NlpC family hydrolase